MEGLDGATLLEMHVLGRASEFELRASLLRGLSGIDPQFFSPWRLQWLVSWFSLKWRRSAFR